MMMWVNKLRLGSTSPVMIPAPAVAADGSSTESALTAHGTPPDSRVTSTTSDSMQGYVEEGLHGGHLINSSSPLDPKDAWLPITESRSGNAFTATFHILCAGLGAQVLLLPVAFSFLGWKTGIPCLVVAFLWQLYTLWILTDLHEAVPSGTRYSRYVHLAQTAFGDKLGKLLSKFPIYSLSAGTCTALIVIGGTSIKLFDNVVCGPVCERSPLSTIEWYLVFTCLAAVLSHLPNLNSLACVSLVGAVAAVASFTIIWVASVSLGPSANVSYGLIQPKSLVARIFGIINGLAIIVFAFRGHNLILEIQGTLPSSTKHSSHVPMRRGVTSAYLVVALCVFPMAIGGYWAYGSSIPPPSTFVAFYEIHGKDISKATLGLTALLMAISCLCSYQIYAMPMFDEMETGYACKNSKRCPWWLRSIFRTSFGAISFFIAIAFPFLATLSGLIGGITLPVTLVFPCFMWNLLKKPKKLSAMWFINWGLGWLGVALSLTFVAGAVWCIADAGIKFHFFKPS